MDTKNYAEQFPVFLDWANEEERKMPIDPYVSLSMAQSYSVGYDGSFLVANEYTGTRDETLAWHLTCSLSAVLNPTPRTIVRGPDAAKFLKRAYVNNIDKFPVNSTKHGILCTDEGYVAAHGVLMRTGENEYEANWQAPYINYRFSQGDYDAEIIDITYERVIYQLQGPRSLEVLENACKQDLHDLGFLRLTNDAKIDGIPVRVIRFGMGGTLAYEVHVDVAYARHVHKCLLEAGAPYGIRQMGRIAYDMNHTPGGSQQSFYHFQDAALADPGFREFVKTWNGYFSHVDLQYFELQGSMGDDITKRFANPIELGLGKVINWDHDFYGKEALLAYKANPKRGIKTLIWNTEDIVDIYASQFTDDPYCEMDSWGFIKVCKDSMAAICNDKVLDLDGNEIGMTGGRGMDWYSHKMYSLGIMDLEFCEDGKEVIVLWGEPGTRQKKIRATVASVPVTRDSVNRSLDVNDIPRYQG